MTFTFYRLVYFTLSSGSLWTHFRNKMSVIKETSCSQRRSLLTLDFIVSMGFLGLTLFLVIGCVHSFIHFCWIRWTGLLLSCLLFLAVLRGLWDFSSQPPGIEHGASAVRTWSPNHWTAREFPRATVLVKLKPSRRYRHLTINYTNTIPFEVSTLEEKLRVL